MVARNVLPVSRVSFAERTTGFEVDDASFGDVKVLPFRSRALLGVVVGQLCLLCERKERIVPSRPFFRPFVKHHDFFVTLSMIVSCQEFPSIFSNL